MVCCSHAFEDQELHHLGLRRGEWGKLAREWCRRMQYFYNLWQEHGSWEAAGGVAAFDAYREPEDYAKWLDGLPAGPTRSKGMELRKLRPRAV